MRFSSRFLKCLVAFAAMIVNAIKCERYKPNWESLDTRPLPTWYDEAKVGIFLHWGVYTVPCMGSEWFWTDWKNLKIQDYVEFMERNYEPTFTYQEFAKDFRAELFNATQWALLFRDSGAKYVVLTSKHHDGYTLWPSKQSFSWNAADVGPKLDIIKELSSALRRHTALRFGVYYSLFEWFNRMYINDKLHIFLEQNYVNNKVQPEQKELVETYLPDIIWSDGDWEAPAKYWKSEQFIAWLYNDSPVRDTVVVNDRWGIGTAGKHGDFYNHADRYNPGVLQKHKWENAFTLDKKSWGQRFDSTLSDFMSPEELIKEIVVTVSCGGNVLVNVGPTKYGTIQPIFEERLRQMGDWLRVNGKAIYASKPWTYQNDSITPDVWYTAQNSPNVTITYIYATVLQYPYERNELTIYPFGKKLNMNSTVAVFGFDEFVPLTGMIDIIMNISLLGMEDTKLTWYINGTALCIAFPPKNHVDKMGLKYAWTFEITLRDYKYSL